MSKFEQSVIDAICESVANGSSARAACRLQHVDESTFRLQRKMYPEFDTQYARALEDRASVWAEEFMEIADDSTNDWVETKFGPQVNREAIERTKLRIDARKWMMARILPKKYGDKLDLNHSGEVAIKRVITDV
jgi:hypothetical protein